MFIGVPVSREEPDVVGSQQKGKRAQKEEIRANVCRSAPNYLLGLSSTSAKIEPPIGSGHR